MLENEDRGVTRPAPNSFLELSSSAEFQIDRQDDENYTYKILITWGKQGISGEPWGIFVNAELLKRYI